MVGMETVQLALNLIWCLALRGVSFPRGNYVSAAALLHNHKTHLQNVWPSKPRLLLKTITTLSHAGKPVVAGTFGSMLYWQ